MRKGSHMTDEQRTRVSDGHKGKTIPSEVRGKISVTLMGHPGYWMGRTFPEMKATDLRKVRGRKISPETRATMVAAQSNRSPETRARISAAKMGHPAWKISPEARAKMSAERWKGGRQVSNARHLAKRRSMGYSEMNQRFVGSVGHHIDNERVINMPRDLHKPTHNHFTGKNMAKVNAVAFNFLFKQEVEAAMKLQTNNVNQSVCPGTELVRKYQLQPCAEREIDNNHLEVLT
jgi:hypothetical protein